MSLNPLLNAVPAISNQQITNLMAMRESYQTLKKRLAIMQMTLEQAEKEILASVEQGADISQCGYMVSIQKIERRYPAWKEELILRLSKSVADSIYQATIPRLYKNLVVKEWAN